MPQVAPSSAAPVKPPPKPGPLEGRELALYAELVESYPLAGDLVLEAEGRRARAVSLLEGQDASQAKGFASYLASAATQLEQARERHSGAAPQFEAVADAVQAEFRTVRAARSYQALHDAITETVLIVLDMVSVVGNAVGACEAISATGGAACSPEVVSAVKPILALETESKAALPSTAEAFREAEGGAAGAGNFGRPSPSAP